MSVCATVCQCYCLFNQCIIASEMFPGWTCTFPPPAFRQNTHGIQMTSIKKRRSPDDELLYLPVSLPWALVIASLSPALNELFLCGHLLIICEWECEEGDRGKRDKQKTYLFFCKIRNYSSPLKFWDRLIMWALPLTTHPVGNYTTNRVLLCKSLKLICPSLLKSDKTILDSLVIPI